MPLTTALAALPAAAPLHAGLTDILNAQHWIDRFGGLALLGILAIVFIETGLLFPLLPGDSLLFTAGALVASHELHTNINIWVLSLLTFLAAFAGTQCGYLIGRTAGPKVFAKPDSRFFKQKYIDHTYSYFDRYGGRTIIVAQFIPFVRTYAPVAAGVGRMKWRHFVPYNFVGALLWGAGVTWLGYALGKVAFVRNNIEGLLLLVVLVSVVPMGIEALRRWRRARRGDFGTDDEKYVTAEERAEVERKAFGS
jgi:membrane-associated protein